MKCKLGKRWIIYWILILFSLVSSTAYAQGGQLVLVMPVTGPVTPVMLGYIQRGIAEAENRQAQALVIQLDTPGGDVNVTQQIVQAMIASTVPVVVYVSPAGAYAASAGTLITMAGHAAAMAPNTSIGAASPVGGQGEDLSSTLKEKIISIMQANVEGLTRRRGERAVQWARQAISEAKAASAEEALQLGVIDFMANDLPDLLRQLDGYKVSVQGQDVTLHTQGAPVEQLPMTFPEQFLSMIANPNVAFILMTLGINGILFELASPGGMIAGVVGAICLLLAFYALGVLDVNYTGLLFIALAFILFVLDIKTPTHGVLTSGGIASFVLGSLVLFNTSFSPVSISLVVSVALATGAFFAFAMAKVVASLHRPVTTGVEALLGSLAVARTDLAPTGTVFLKGEHWEAEAEDGPIAAGDRVRVTEVHGFRLRVRREPPNTGTPRLPAGTG
jgi:membrane-bound serine protease (ClpP class)